MLLLLLSVSEEVIGMSKNLHIVKSPNGWGIRKEGNSQLSSTFATQREAISKGREMAIQGRCELLIHGMNAKIRERNSYGNDPFPPKG